MEDFSVKAYQREKIQCFELKGSLHAACAEVLSKEVDAYLEQDIKSPVILYLAELDYISSAGLREIFKLVKYCQMYDLKIMVHKAQESVAKVFEMIQLVPHLSLFEDEQMLEIFINDLQK